MTDISRENQALSREDEEAKRWMETLEADLMAIRENLRQNDILVDRMLEDHALSVQINECKKKRKLTKRSGYTCGRFKNYSLTNIGE